MKNESALVKGKKLFLNEKVFLMNNDGRYSYFIVRGNNDVYNVTYDKAKDYWNCTCKNIRLKDCSHIIAAKLLKGD